MGGWGWGAPPFSPHSLIRGVYELVKFQRRMRTRVYTHKRKKREEENNNNNNNSSPLAKREARESRACADIAHSCVCVCAREIEQAK